MTLILLKFLVSIAAVLLISFLAEHTSPRMAGVLSGYPLGNAISLYFYAHEISVDFAAKSAKFSVLGFLATAAFAFGFCWTATRVKQWAFFWSALIGFLFYFGFSWGLTFVRLGIWGSLALSGCGIFIISFLLKHIENIQIKRVRLTKGMLAIRALIGALLVLVITGVAKSVGQNWAGLFAAFPVTVFPSILIIYLAYGKAPVLTMLKNLPKGLGSVLAFAVTVHFSFPFLGYQWGMLAAFGVATAYLVATEALMRQFKD